MEREREREESEELKVVTVSGLIIGNAEIKKLADKGEGVTRVHR